jgi:hypothetical protein
VPLFPEAQQGRGAAEVTPLEFRASDFQVPGEACDIFAGEVDKSLLLTAAYASGLALKAHGRVYRESRNSRWLKAGARRVEFRRLESKQSRIRTYISRRSNFLAKALIMIVRVLGLAAIVLGALLWSGHKEYLAPHIGGGFFVAIVVLVLAVIALTKKAVVPGILGIALACLLPVVGFMQLPLTFHTLGVIQVVHIIFALGTIGVAERLYAAIRAN